MKHPVRGLRPLFLLLPMALIAFEISACSPGSGVTLNAISNSFVTSTGTPGTPGTPGAAFTPGATIVVSGICTLVRHSCNVSTSLTTNSLALLGVNSLAGATGTVTGTPTTNNVTARFISVNQGAGGGITTDNGANCVRLPCTEGGIAFFDGNGNIWSGSQEISGASYSVALCDAETTTATPGTPVTTECPTFNAQGRVTGTTPNDTVTFTICPGTEGLGPVCGINILSKPQKGRKQIVPGLQEQTLSFVCPVNTNCLEVTQKPGVLGANVL